MLSRYQSTNGKSKNRYHTQLMLDVKTGRLPDSIKKLIPRQTLYNFKKYDINKIFGYDFYADEHTQSFNKIVEELYKSSRLLKICKAVILIKNTIIKIKSKIIQSKYSYLKIKEYVIQTIDKVKSVFSLKKVLKLFQMTKYQYHSWINQIKHFCPDSILKKCFNVWTNQLTLNEIKKIKELCLDKRFKGWPIASIAYFALRHKLVSASLATWYKYTKLLKLNRKPPKCMKKRKTGIRASSPNQMWHADITVFTTMDNVKAYIYLIVDNFSRFILNYHVSLKISAKTRLHTIKKALDDHVPDKNSTNTDLIVDGGSENNNSIVENFIQETDYNIQKLIAQKDIHFSNSIVEASNKLIKYHHLFLYDIPEFESLKKHLDQFIPVYNQERPHISLKGLTPFQVYSGVQINKEQINSQMKSAYEKRIQENKKYRCQECNR